MNKMLKFLQEIGLSVEQIHGQSEIQMANVPKAWQLGELMANVSTIICKQDFSISRTCN
jgi:hypothetical protein